MIDFINRVSAVAVKDWRERRIMLPSVVIAQAILESGWGKSELAVNAKALFGIKKNGWTGKTYIKGATEQRPDGSYYYVNNTEWRAYDSWDESIIDHNTYIATRKVGNALRYEAVIGNTDVKAVCQLLKDCGYSTSLTYPDKLLDLINKCGLTEYDSEVDKVAKICIDAGHGLYTSGKRCMKKLDSNETREWVLNDRIADKLEVMLKSYNCEVLRADDTTGLTDVSLANRVKKANNWGADIYISIHHNAGVNGGSGGGTQVYYYSSKAERKTQATKLYNNIVNMTKLVGNRSSRVIKYPYYVLKNTKAPALLIENGFMDSSTDVPVILSETHSQYTAQGILNFLVSELGLTKVAGEVEPESDVIYRVQCGAFKNKAGAETLRDKLKADGYEAVVVSGN
jgi:N-acetylmuramoyl-L-alanine amidase